MNRLEKKHRQIKRNAQYARTGVLLVVLLMVYVWIRFIMYLINIKP